MLDAVNEFENFLQQNMNGQLADAEHGVFREGVCMHQFLCIDPVLLADAVLRCRFQYIRNLCLNEPVEFGIPDVVGRRERALMLLSFNRVAEALAVLELPFCCEVIGADAKTRTGASITTLVLSCSNTQCRDAIDYEADGYCYTNFRVQPLQSDELLYCYIKMIDIIRNEDNETIKNCRIRAYLRRVLMDENELDEHFTRAFLVIKAEFEQSTAELEKIKNNPVQISEELFSSPLVFKFDLMIQLGLAYKHRSYFQAAYDCLLPYPLFIEKIDCLIGLRKSEEAVVEINGFIKRIGNAADRESRLVLCGLYMKLAHIFQDPSYFDKAVEAFRCPKPLYLKGLLYYKMKDYEQSVDAFATALTLSPQDAKIRFSYACSLVETNNIKEAHEIFKELKLEDPMNEKIAKNLSYCYYKLNDIENMLVSLRNVAMGDENAMNQFFILSVKNEILPNIKWALGHMCTTELIKGGVAHLLQTGKMSRDELVGILKANPYIDETIFGDLFG